MHGEHDWNAASFEPLDRCGQEIAGGALYDVLDEGAEPAAVIRPLAPRVVLERHIRRRTLKFALGKPCLRIRDPSAGRQRQIEIAVFETGHDGTRGERLPGANGDTNRT